MCLVHLNQVRLLVPRTAKVYGRNAYGVDTVTWSGLSCLSIMCIDNAQGISEFVFPSCFWHLSIEMPSGMTQRWTKMIYLSRFPACQTSFKIKPCDEAGIYLNDEKNYWETKSYIVDCMCFGWWLKRWLSQTDRNTHIFKLTQALIPKDRHLCHSHQSATTMSNAINWNCLTQTMPAMDEINEKMKYKVNTLLLQ